MVGLHWWLVGLSTTPLSLQYGLIIFVMSVNSVKAAMFTIKRPYTSVDVFVIFLNKSVSRCS